MFILFFCGPRLLLSIINQSHWFVDKMWYLLLFGLWMSLTVINLKLFWNFLGFRKLPIILIITKKKKKKLIWPSFIVYMYVICFYSRLPSFLYRSMSVIQSIPSIFASYQSKIWVAQCLVPPRVEFYKALPILIVGSYFAQGVFSYVDYTWSYSQAEPTWLVPCLPLFCQLLLLVVFIGAWPN
jgi:hypothetical protein